MMFFIFLIFMYLYMHLCRCVVHSNLFFFDIITSAMYQNGYMVPVIISKTSLMSCWIGHVCSQCNLNSMFYLESQIHYWI